MQERGAEAIRLRGDSGVFLSGEGTIDETLGSTKQVGCRGSSDEQVGGCHGTPWWWWRPQSYLRVGIFLLAEKPNTDGRGLCLCKD